MGQSYATPSQSQKDPRSSTTALAQSPAKGNESGGGVGATLSRWWSGAADWAGERYNDVSTAVSDTYNGVKKTVSEFRDVYQKSDVGYQDGKLTASTDADEVLDVLPASFRDQLKLDKSNPDANRINLEMDTATGQLTLRIPDLQLSSLDLGGVSAGKTAMTGVVLTVANADGIARSVVERKAGATAAGWIFGKNTAPKDVNNTSTLRISRVSSQDVRYNGASPMAARELELSNLSATLSNKDGGVPMMDNTPDKLNATFSVGSAVVRGLSGAGVSADELGGAGLEATLSQTDEKGTLSARRLGATGLTMGDQRLGAGEAHNLRASFSNQGGGMPLFDGKKDQLALSAASADKASVNGLKSAQLNVGAGQAEGLSVRRDASRNHTDVAARSVTGTDVAAKTGASSSGGTMGVQVGAASLTRGQLNDQRVEALSATDLRTDINANGVSGRIGSGKTTGLDTPWVDAKQLDAQGFSWATGQSGVKLGLEQGTSTGLDVMGNRMDTAAVQGLSVNVGEKMGIGLEKGRATGLDSAVLDAGSLDVARAQWDMAGGHQTMQAGQVQGQQVDLLGNRARTVQGSDVGMTLDKGSFTGRAGDLALTGLDTGVADADAARVQGAQVAYGDTHSHAGIQHLDVQGLRSAAVNADQITGRGLSGTLGTESGQLNAEGLTANGVVAGNNRVKRATLSGLETKVADVGGTLRDGSVENLAAGGSVRELVVGGVDTAGVDADAATVRNAQFSHTATQSSGGVGSVDIQGLRSDVGSASRLTGSGLAGTLGTDTAQVKADALAGEGLVSGTNRARSASLSGLDAKVSDVGGTLRDGAISRLGTEGRVEQAAVQGVDTATVDVANAQARGLTWSGQDGAMQGGLRQGSAQNIAVDQGSQKVSVGSVQGEHLTAAKGAQGVGLQADQLGARDIRYQGQLNKSGETSSGVNLGQAARLIDDVDMQARLPLNAGDYGMIDVDPNTTVDARLRAQDGVLDTQNTRASFSRPLDAPLWINVKGAYLEDAGSGQMKTMADVGGWGDQDITKDLPGGRKTLPTELGALTDTLTAPSTAPSTGSNKKSDEPSLASAPRLDQLTAQGSVSLKSGDAQLGGSSATLRREQEGDNTAQVSVSGANNLALTFTRLLVGNLNLQVGQQQVQAEDAKVTGASLQVQSGGNATQVTGSIGSVEVKDAGAQMR